MSECTFHPKIKKLSNYEGSNVKIYERTIEKKENQPIL